MALVATRDPLGEFLLLLDSTNGRDKVCRLVQYSAKAMKWRAETEKQPAETIKMWNELMASMGLVRKVLRFFKSLAVLRQLRAGIPADASKMDLALFLNLCAKFCLANYFLWDHFMFANKIGMWTPKDPKQLELMGNMTEGSWLAEICFTLTENLVRLSNLASAPETPAVATARAAALRAVVRNACDLPVAAHFLKLGPFATHPHGHFGLLGAVSSSISLYEMWPTVIVGVPQKKA